MNSKAKATGLITQINKICPNAATTLTEADIDDAQLLNLTRQDLNDLLPGPSNFKIRRQIMDLITSSKQKPICPTVESLMNSLLDLVPKNTAEDLKRALVSGNVLHEYRHILKDMEMQLKGVLDFLQQHIHQLDRLTQDNQKQVVENKHKEERPSESHSSNKLHQPSEDPWTSIYPPKSDVLIEIVHGQNMLGIERMFMSKLSQHLANFAVQVVTKTYDHTSVNSVLLFCPVFSRTGTVIEEALKKIPSTKEIVLVVMHHTHNPDLVLAESSRLVKKCNLAEIVDCLFHESRGLLECEINSQAILQVSSALQKYLT